MKRTVTANLTYSSQANRDAAKTRVDNALAAVDYSPRSNYLTSQGGIETPTSTTLVISIEVPPQLDADEVASTIFSALVGGTRHTVGWISVNKF